jgi:alpha-galactosidase
MQTSHHGCRLAAGAAIALLCVLMPSPGRAQTLAGRWVGTDRVLDNGEKLISILELKQDGKQLTGTLKSESYSMDVHGTATGTHFELFGPRSATRPMITGDLANGELHGTVFGRREFVAKLATSADRIPEVKYIAPPALHDVPDNGLAKTPPMGWNSWNLFAGKVDDATVRTIADAIVSSGMRDAGYIYVNIDDTWEGVRDADGNLQTNHKFPDMKALADYVHSKGLKLGIYSGPGPRTCAGYPASYGHEEQDARTFAAWGIDYLKYDWCSAATIYKDSELQPVYQKMGGALEATGRPIVYGLCEYGRGQVETWGTKVGGNLWRTTGDINDSWSSMIGNLEKQVPLAPYAGPGHWNDPDMLEIGNGHMTDDEYRTHMSLWALVAAPLLAGNDIRNMSDGNKGHSAEQGSDCGRSGPAGKAGLAGQERGHGDVGQAAGRWKRGGGRGEPGRRGYSGNGECKRSAFARRGKERTRSLEAPGCAIHRWQAHGRSAVARCADAAGKRTLAVRRF